MSRQERKQKVDKVAAAVILQQYLETHQMKEEQSMADERNDEMLNPDDEPDALAEGDIIEMIDDSGETIRFTFVDALEYEGETYLALSDPQADEDSDDIEVFILKIDQDENGEDVYSVPDDDVADAVFQKLVDLTDEME